MRLILFKFISFVYSLHACFSPRSHLVTLFFVFLESTCICISVDFLKPARTMMMIQIRADSVLSSLLLPENYYVIQRIMPIKLLKNLFFCRISTKRMRKWSKNVDFTMRVCEDVLIDIISFGDRRQIAKIEDIGTRFQRCIERNRPERPFILFDLECMNYGVFSI